MKIVLHTILIALALIVLMDNGRESRINHLEKLPDHIRDEVYEIKPKYEIKSNKVYDKLDEKYIPRDSQSIRG